MTDETTAAEIAAAEAAATRTAATRTAATRTAAAGVLPDVVDPAARTAYEGDGLADDVTGPPYPWLVRWYADAEADPRIVEPGAMALATVDEHGRPDARTVLLKSLTPQGLVFFTNTRSAKGHQLAGTPSAALVLLWHPMYRQVRVRGVVVPTTPQVAAEYFASRPRGSQLATRASRQSQPIGSRAELRARVVAEEERWPDDGSRDDVPAPSTWGGYLVRPDEVELWVGQRSRLHDRVRFDRIGDGDLGDARAWRTTRLQP
ncbi:MAG: pyridoxamine 5'-phosphate oxidase [Angustibacter sp.]